MLRLLQLNAGRRWTFRVDGPGSGGVVRDVAKEVIVVIELHLGREALSEAASLVLEAWREKTLAQAMIFEMKGEIDV